MEKEFLDELRELRIAIAKVVGTLNKPPGEQFSIAALEKAEKEFQKLSIERNEWIEERNIDKIIKSAPWNAGKFIREHFQFSNYFKKGVTHFYNKADLQLLAQELKNRNIDLERYMEFIASETKFKTDLEKAEQNKKEKTVTFIVPDDVHDITTSFPQPPSRDIIKEDIKNLKRQFRQNNLDDYIDTYRDRYAMMKKAYWFDKYIDPAKKSQCNKWIKEFNYAIEALAKVKEAEKERAKGSDRKISTEQIDGDQIEKNENYNTNSETIA